MAKLKPCRDCGHMISTNADRCPSCGVGKPGRGLTQRHPLMVLLALGFAISGVHSVVAAPMDTSTGGSREMVVSGAVVPEPVVREAPAASPPSPWALMIGFWLAPILLSMSLGWSIKASFETKQSETEPPNRP